MTNINGKIISRGQSVVLSVLQNGVAVVTFDSADSRVNLLSSSVMAELASVVDKLEIPGKFKGVVFASAKPNCFIAGADIKEIVQARSMPASVAFDGCQDGKQLLNRIKALPMRKVAAIHGRCLGGGAELTLVCNERIASDSPSTVIGLPEVGLGVLPGCGGTVRATKMLGFAQALPLVLNPLKPFSARHSWRVGLVSEVVSADMLFTRAVDVVLGAEPKRFRPSSFEKAMRVFTDYAPGRQIVKAIARFNIKKQTKGKLPAPYAALKVMEAALTKSAFKAFELESRTFAELCHTPECGECVQKFMDYQKSKKEKSGA